MEKVFVAKSKTVSPDRTIIVELDMEMNGI